jgi:L-lysine 2,3-aminomutase
VSLNAQLPVQTDSRPGWQRQLAEAYTSPQQLGQALQLPEDWVRQHAPARRLFTMRVPRHFVSLMEPGNPDDPLLRQVWPLQPEFEEVPGYGPDPLGEESASVQNGILHKYRSRLLLIVRGGCAVNCRYCFRRHFPYDNHQLNRQEFPNIARYIESKPDINEVILSGGDPLLAKDEHLAALLEMLEALPQLKRVRIHSRLPVVIPQRLTEQLAKRLQQSRLQAILVIHANHGREISPALKENLQAWRKMGIHLLNQSVLLKGVNDNVDTLSELSEALFDAQVMPYYLHQLDKVAGAAHFSVSDANANLLLQGMMRRLPGFLVPKLVQEIAGEASKTPLPP